MKLLIIASAALTLTAAVPMSAQQAASQYRYGVLGDGEPSGLPMFWTFAPVETQVVKGVPYSAEIVSEFVQTLADGNRIAQRRTSRVYRDGQGRVRREEDQATGVTSISIMDPVTGKGFTLDAATRTARETPPMVISTAPMMIEGVRYGTFSMPMGTTYDLRLAGLPTRTGLRQRAGGGGEPVEEKLPDRSIEGVLATGVRRTTTIAKGAIGNEQPIKIVSEEWTSPELQILVLTEHNDPRTGRSTYRLLKISRLEPDAALFQVPADYTIQSAGRGRGRGN
jgi:hypothetical protein